MNNVKSLKNVALGSLLLFLGAFTLTPEPIRLSKTLWNIEAYSLVAALTTSEWPDSASIPAMEAKFGFAPMMAPQRGLVVDIIRGHYREKAILEGRLRTSFGENVTFHYRPEQPNSMFAQRRKAYQDYEKLYTGANKIDYAEYSIASLAFPGKWHDVLLADGAIFWTGVENKVADGWAVVGDEPPLYIKLDEFSKEALNLAIPWAGIQTDINKSYYEVLKAYRGQELTLPVVGAKIPWRIAGGAIVVTAIYLSILFVHAMLCVRDRGVERDEQWLLVEPARPNGRFERLLFRSMTVLGGSVLALFMSLPAATIFLVKPTIPNWAFLIALAVTVLLTLLGLKELFGIAKRGELEYREVDTK